MPQAVKNDDREPDDSPDPWDVPPFDQGPPSSDHITRSDLEVLPGGKAHDPVSDLERDADALTGTHDPQAPVEAEVAVLGAAFLDATAARQVAADIGVEHMTHPHRAMVAQAIQRLVSADQVVDLVSVATALREQRLPGAIDTVARITEASPTAANVQRDIETVLQAHEGREERRLRTAISGAGLHVQPQRIEELEQHLARVERRRNAQTAAPTFAETLHECLRRMEKGHEVAPRVTSDIWSLDEIAGGFPTQGLTVIAARPGMGKSTFATCVLPHVISERDNRPAIFFSLEMPRDELTFCLLASITGIPRLRLCPSSGEPAHLTDSEWGRSVKFTADIAALPLVIEDRPVQTPAFMRATIERVLRETGADAPSVIVVDYLQKVSPEGATLTKGASREQEVGWIAEQLRVFARDFKAPVLALAQLNRQLEGRRDKRPTMSDLRESGSIEQDSHLVLGLYRPSYYDEDATDEVDEILVLKNRAGPLGTARCRYIGPEARWTNLPTGARP